MPPALITETTANWAEPANVVSDITIEAAPSKPAACESTPNETPNASTAGSSGVTARRPAP